MMQHISTSADCRDSPRLGRGLRGVAGSYVSGRRIDPDGRSTRQFKVTFKRTEPDSNEYCISNPEFSDYSEFYSPN